MASGCRKVGVRGRRADLMVLMEQQTSAIELTEAVSIAVRGRRADVMV